MAQMDLFSIADADGKEAKLKRRSKKVLAAIRRIDPDINVVAIFCDAVHSFVVERNGRFDLYIFNDFKKLDSFRSDNFSFSEIPSNFIKVK